MSPKILSALGLAIVLLAGSCLSLQGCDSATDDPTKGDTSTLLLVTPRGGETYKVGSTLLIKWREQGVNADSINFVSVLLSPDSGKSFFFITPGIARTDTNWEKVSYTIPASIKDYIGNDISLANNPNCMIEVLRYAAPEFSEKSKVFTVIP